MSHESESGQTVRFGIMSENGLRFADWQARCIRQLLALPDVRPALLIHNATPVSASATARLKRARPNLVLGQVYRNLLSRPAALREVDLSDALAGVPSMACRVTMRGRFSEYFSDADVAAIRGHHLAFILRFGFNIIRGDILGAARFGVWSFHHGDEQRVRGVSEGFWEIYRGEPVAGAILQRLTESLDAGVVLRKGHFAVVGHSWTKTRDRLHAESARWPAQVCTDIRNGVAGYVDAGASTSTAPVYRRPSNLQTVVFGCKVLGNAVRYWFDRAFVQTTWGLGVIHESAERLLTSPQPPIHYVAGSSSPYRYLADPFILDARRPQAVSILCEEYDQFAGGRGRLVHAEIAGGAVTRLVPVMPLDAHASYPCVLHCEDGVFCVPEVPAAGRVELYRRVPQTERWVVEATLVEGFAAADPTIFRHGDRWWLAACPIGEGQYHNLFLWHAAALRGPWRPHPANPVKSDVTSARSAGNPFTVGGVLYRPAQDCSDGYGRRVVINAVETLTPLEFRERVVAVLKPEEGGPLPHGIHTLSTAGRIAVVDGRRDFFDPLKQVKKRLLARTLRARARPV